MIVRGFLAGVKAMKTEREPGVLGVGDREMMLMIVMINTRLQEVEVKVLGKRQSHRDTK